jgi:hypothetical protein
MLSNPGIVVIIGITELIPTRNDEEARPPCEVGLFIELELPDAIDSASDSEGRWKEKPWN